MTGLELEITFFSQCKKQVAISDRLYGHFQFETNYFNANYF